MWSRSAPQAGPEAHVQVIIGFVESQFTQSLTVGDRLKEPTRWETGGLQTAHVQCLITVDPGQISLQKT